MTDELITTLAEHAAGNPRILMTMANELLDAAIQSGARQLDEKLYLETFAVPAAPERGRLRLPTVRPAAPVPHNHAQLGRHRETSLSVGLWLNTRGVHGPSHHFKVQLIRPIPNQEN